MPESLQQKVDRMTAGMEVTVTFRDGREWTVVGEVCALTSASLSLAVGRDAVRYSDGEVGPYVTAIDMPDPECPYSKGDRLLSCSGVGFTATGRMVWCETCKTWDVEGKNADEPYTARALKAPVTLVPPEPAEHDHKGFSEEKCVRCGWVMGRAPLNCMNDDTPHVFPSQQQRASDRCERVEPAEPDCPAILVTYTDGTTTYVAPLSRGMYGQYPLDDWLTRPDVATVQALRPAEYLRGGQ